MFYEPGRMTRNGAMPKSMLRLLQDEGSVATLDGEAHRRRKAMFMEMMTPERLSEMARMAADALRARAEDWPARGQVTLHEEFREAIGRAVCGWVGLHVEAREASRLTRECGAMIDYAATLGPKNWRARMTRHRSERFLRDLAERARSGEIRPPAGSPFVAIVEHHDAGGRPLDPEVCAVELLNLIRPTIAIARFMTFAALALHEHPEARSRLVSDEAYREAFAQETRRLYPFFAMVGRVARDPFEWRGRRFEAGERFVLDLHGTDHDERLWEAPDEFRPERFLGWPGDPFTMIPQGGGDHHVNHRCAGEWLTIEVMKAMLLTLARDLDYDVPEQDLTIDTREIPALPRSGVVIENARLRPEATR